MNEQDLVKQLRARPYSNPSYWMLEAADEIERNRATMETQATLISDMRGEIERLKSYTAAYNTLLAERVEIECLRGLAIRAWHSFRSGLTAGGGCDCGLTDADIEELVRLANAADTKNRERGVLHDCRQGKQRCHECPNVECSDNMTDEANHKNRKSTGE